MSKRVFFRNATEIAVLLKGNPDTSPFADIIWIFKENDLVKQQRTINCLTPNRGAFRTLLNI